MQMVVVLARSVDNESANAKVISFTEDVVANALQSFSPYPNAQSHPTIALYRDTLKTAFGLSPKKFPQSNESLTKRLLKEKKALRPINPIVDFYNSVSIKHCVTLGAFDLEELKKLGPDGEIIIELRFSSKEDRFLALDAPTNAEPVPLQEGEITYAQGHVVLTRQMAWRQSLQGLVTPKSKDVIFMSEIFHDEDTSDPVQLAKDVSDELKNGLKEVFGVDSTVHLLGPGLGQLNVEI